jgi:hypothetical protein
MRTCLFSGALSLQPRIARISSAKIENVASQDNDGELPNRSFLKDFLIFSELRLRVSEWNVTNAYGQPIQRKFLLDPPRMALIAIQKI